MIDLGKHWFQPLRRRRIYAAGLVATLMLPETAGRALQSLDDMERAPQEAKLDA